MKVNANLAGGMNYTSIEKLGLNWHCIGRFDE